MSLNIPSVRAVKVLDPRLEINQSREYVALKGAQVNSWQQFNGTNINNSSVQITANPPNRNIAISRLVLKKYVFDISISGTNTNVAGTLLQSGYYAPRAYPISSVTSSEQMTINNDTITQAPLSQYWPALLRYHNPYDSRFGQMSLTPSMLDQFQLLEDGAQSVRNPLAGYENNSFENTRGGYVGLEILSNPLGGVGTFTATLRLTVYEPILISPFVYGCGSNYTSALVDVENMSYTCTLGNLNRVLSLITNQGAPGVISLNLSSQVTNLSSASLLFEYLTPDPVNPIPKNLVSSYFSIVSYPTKTSTPIAPGGAVSITMQSIQVTSIPRRIYVFARDDDSVLTAESSDTFMSLNPNTNPLTLTWNNNQFMSQATIADLYNIAYKNGCNMSYSQFTNFCGSVLCLDFGTDIGLMSDEAPGLLGNYQLGLTAQFLNTRSTSITPTLYVVVVYEGTFNIINGNCDHKIGVLSRSDVLQSSRDPMINYKQVESVFGGDFFSNLKKGMVNAGNKTNNFLKKSKLLSSVASAYPHPGSQAAAKVLKNLGYGRSGGSLNSNKKLTKKDLLNKLRNIDDDESKDDSEYSNED